MYVWTRWGFGGAAGSIGFWVYDRGTWKNVDTVERLSEVIPRAPDEVWLVPEGDRRGSTISVIKGGRHITGDEARQLLAFDLQFAHVRQRARGADGTAILLLEGAAGRDPRAAEEPRALAVRREGPAVDLGQAAGAFLKRTWTSHPIFDPQGRLWGGSHEGLEAMSPDGRITAYPITKRFPQIRLAAANGKHVYFEAGRKLWQFDPATDRQSADAEPLLPAMRVRIRGCASADTLGRTWCVWDVPFSPTVVFDGTSWKPCLEKDCPDRPEKYATVFRGAGGAMIFVGPQYRFHLFDADGHVVADSAEELALQYPDRLGKALPYPPYQDVDQNAHLVKDAKGRIWWAKGHESWGVVDGKTAIRGEMADLLEKVPQGRFTVVYPIGDGARVLVGFQAFKEGASGVYGVENGRIVRLAESPVRVVGPSSVYPQTTAQCDSAGRVWIMRDRENPGPAWIRPVSQMIDPRGKSGPTHSGWLMLEDRNKGLWFKQASLRPESVARLDASGHDTTLEVPNLTNATSFAEAPDGSVWTLTHTELIRLHANANQLSITERYPTPVQDSDRVWCDREGRVWMVHTTVPTGVPGQDRPYTELIRFATKP